MAVQFGDECELRVECGLQLGENLRILRAQTLHDGGRDHDLRNERLLLFVRLLEQHGEVALQFDRDGERRFHEAMAGADGACGRELREQ